MDLATERKHLALAERHLLEGADRIRRQASLLDHLRRDGLNTDAAKTLLQTLRETLSVWRDHRDEILRTIARLEAGDI